MYVSSVLFKCHIYRYYVYYLLSFFFLMFRHKPRSTLFPYTTLFRSARWPRHRFGGERGGLESLGRSRRRRPRRRDRKSTRLNSSHTVISYAVFCLKKKKNENSSNQ